MDCHLELGNNACLAKLLHLNSVQMHKVGNTENLLWSGLLSKPMSGSQFTNFLEKYLGVNRYILQVTIKPINSIAWCSGAAQDYIEDAQN